MVELTASKKRELVETSRTDYSVREISETLGFNRSLFYYQPKGETSDEALRDEIQRLASRYPKYGYRRITALLVRIDTKIEGEKNNSNHITTSVAKCYKDIL